MVARGRDPFVDDQAGHSGADKESDNAPREVVDTAQTTQVEDHVIYNILPLRSKTEGERNYHSGLKVLSLHKEIDKR